MLNDYLNYVAAISEGATAISRRTIDYGFVSFTTYKMTDCLTKQISKHESLDNINKEQVKDLKKN